MLKEFSQQPKKAYEDFLELIRSIAIFLINLRLMSKSNFLLTVMPKKVGLFEAIVEELFS